MARITEARVTKLLTQRLNGNWRMAAQVAAFALDRFGDGDGYLDDEKVYEYHAAYLNRSTRSSWIVIPEPRRPVRPCADLGNKDSLGVCRRAIRENQEERRKGRS